MAKIIHKKSSVAGKTPLTTDLDYGELAINYADGKLYYKDSNNNIQQIVGAGGGIPNSGGTANGIVYYNGSQVATSSTALTFDGTNVATTGTLSATKLIATGGTATGNGLYLPTTNTLAISTDGTERVRIDSSGNIGIGVSPTYRLDVSSASTSTGSTVIRNSNTQSGISGSLHVTGSAYSYAGVGASSVWLQPVGGNLTLGPDGAFYTSIVTNGAERVRIDSSGNVGIGTNNPLAPLNVYENTAASSTPQVAIRIGRQGGLTGQASGALFFDIGGGGGQAQLHTIRGSSSGGTLVFSTGDTAGTMLERVRIDSSGKLLVNTNAAIYGLEGQVQNYAAQYNYLAAGPASSTVCYALRNVNNDTGVVVGSITYNATGTSFNPSSTTSIGTSGSNTLSFGTNAVERVRIDSSGSVAIGHTGPTGKLDVLNSIHLRATTDEWAVYKTALTHAANSADNTARYYLVARIDPSVSWTGGLLPTITVYQTYKDGASKYMRYSLTMNCTLNVLDGINGASNVLRVKGPVTYNSNTNVYELWIVAGGYESYAVKFEGCWTYGSIQTVSQYFTAVEVLTPTQVTSTATTSAPASLSATPNLGLILGGTNSNVGIGTGTHGTAKLYVWGNDAATPSTITYNSAGGSAFQAVIGSLGSSQFRNVSTTSIELHLRASSGKDNYITFTEDSVADRWTIGTDAGNGSFLWKAGNPTSATEYMRLTSGGRLIVGGTAVNNAAITSNNYQVGFEVNNANLAAYQWYVNNGPTDKKIWRAEVDSTYGDWTLNAINDAYTSTTTRFKVNNTGGIYVTGASSGVYSAGISLQTTTDGDVYRLQMGRQAYYLSNIVVGKDSATANAYSSYLAFETTNSANTLAERMRLDSNGNLGLGITPSAWAGGLLAMQVSRGAISGNTSEVDITHNANYDSGWKYIGSAGATRYYQNASQVFVWQSAASGTAGAALTWTDRMALDASGNLGLGVTPSAWGSGYRALQGYVGAFALSADGTNNNQMRLSSNAFNNGTNWIYYGSSYATSYEQRVGEHRFYTAASGTAGNAITFTQAMTLNSSGNLGIGLTDPDQKLTVNGGIRITASATLVANSTPGIISYEYPVVRQYVGDGTGYSWALSKRSSSTTTDLVTLSDLTGVMNFAVATPTIQGAEIATKNFVASGTQTLSNKTLVDPVITGTILEDIFTITDGAAFEIDPGNGSIQLITLGASRTPKATNFAAGESVTLMVDDGTAYALTWTDATWGGSGVVWKTSGGTAPALNTTGYTVIVLWKVGSQVYGARVGDA